MVVISSRTVDVELVQCCIETVDPKAVAYYFVQDLVEHSFPSPHENPSPAQLMTRCGSPCFPRQTYHDVGLLCIVGGKTIKADIKGFRRSPPPDILVATPGRLNDHLQNHDLASYVRELQHLVFDEADQVCVPSHGAGVCHVT